jgi:hypothetical protein
MFLIYIYTYICVCIFIGYEKILCRYTPEPPCPQPQRVGALGLGLDTHHLPDGGGGASPVNRHDSVFLKKRCHVAIIWPIIEHCSPGKRPHGHEASHHATILEHVPDVVCVVWIGLFKKPLEVDYRRHHLLLITMCVGRRVSPTGAARLTIIAIGCGPLKALLAPLSATFDALLGVVGGDVRRHLPIASWGHRLASLGRAKHDYLIAGSALGGDATWHLEHVPKGFSTSALPWDPCVSLR